MSKVAAPRSISIEDLKKAKRENRKISMVTCYDSAFASLIAESNIDTVLVGDSMGNVVLGYESTLKVSMEDVIHHTRAVSAKIGKQFLCADMPFGSYQTSVEEAVHNAIRLVKEGGAHAVKLEGGEFITPQIRAISSIGIPVVAHLGLTPQSIHKLGGYKVQGREVKARELLIEDAKAVQEAGADMLVLELVPADLAAKITELLDIPTIGIGAGAACDGQVLVLHDMLGFDDSFSPKFLKKYLDLGTLVKQALDQYDNDVKSKHFPADEHCY